MKNIIEICKGFGIEIPAEKHADFLKAVAVEYKTTAEVEKKVNRLSEDLEAEKIARKTAEDTLKGLEGKDFDAITKERDEWQRKHRALEESQQREKEEREFKDMLTSAIAEYKGKNAMAITALLDLDALKKSKNQEKDIRAALKSVKEKDSYLFEADGTPPPARFDIPGKTGTPPAGVLTKKDIAAIKDPAERQAKIAANMHLFK